MAITSLERKAIETAKKTIKECSGSNYPSGFLREAERLGVDLKVASELNTWLNAMYFEKYKGLIDAEKWIDAVLNPE